jgi:hypothetical protein
MLVTLSHRIVSNQAPANSPPRGLRAIGDPQLFDNVVRMTIHRAGGDPQPTADLFIGYTLRDKV